VNHRGFKHRENLRETKKPLVGELLGSISLAWRAMHEPSDQGAMLYRPAQDDKNQPRSVSFNWPWWMRPDIIEMKLQCT